MKLTILLPFALLGFANATPQILPPPSNTWHERTFDPVRNGESAAAASFQEAARTVPDIELKYMFDLVKKAKGGLDAVKLGVGKPIDLKALKLFARDELRDSQSPSRVLSEEEVEAIIAEQYNSTASAELEKRDSRPESWHKVWADAAFRGRTEKLIWRDKQCYNLKNGWNDAISSLDVPWRDACTYFEHTNCFGGWLILEGMWKRFPRGYEHVDNKISSYVCNFNAATGYRYGEPPGYYYRK